VRFAVFLYSRKLIVIRAGSTEPREPVNEARTPRVLRGFSPHLVADDDIINGCCGRIVRDRGPLDSSARNASAPRATLHRHLLFSCYIALRARAFRAAMRSYPLLPPRTGRHDVGEVGGRHDAPHLGFTTECRHRGKEFAEHRFGRLTAELPGGGRHPPLQHGRHRVGWGRNDVTDSP
jgi:hypothetical protein